MRKGSFAKSLDRFAFTTLKRGDDVRRGVILKLFGAVVMDTPVLYGRLRGNWMVSKGNPNNNTRKRKDPTGQMAFKEIEAMAKSSRFGDTVWLSNSLPYAHRIEYGYSKKAPQGMVRRNVARFKILLAKQVQQAKGGSRV